MIKIRQDKNEIKIYFPQSVPFNKVSLKKEALCYAPKFKCFKETNVRKYFGFDIDGDFEFRDKVGCSIIFDINKSDFSLIIDFIDKLAKNLNLSIEA